MESQADAVYLSSLTLAELRYGVSLAPVARQALLKDFVGRLQTVHADGILPIKESVLIRWKRLLAELKQLGRVMSCEDSLLAAHALELGFGVATLNAVHFAPAGVVCARF
ncbi:MAG: PIN domain-containing protein [Gammaproteobacteria bacterium]|nr:PIN domain-containing protein [Gammaproteobacteria bacterium]